MIYKILVINPGSVSTKIAVYENHNELFSRNIEHRVEELAKCESLLDQYPMRKNVILSILRNEDFDLKTLDAIAARGGTFGRIEGGAYLIDENLIKASKNPLTNHPSNLAAIIAYDIAEELNVKSYIYDAVCVDETEKIASFTGIKGVKRKFNSHVLNTRAACREMAQRQGREYEDMNFIVAHLGGGLSINVHKNGRIIDVISDDEGPMSPERAGGINSVILAEMCYNGEYTKKQMLRLLKGAGGLVSHLGTNSAAEVEEMIKQGNSYAKEVYEAMAYQIAKGISGLAAVVNGKVDYIILTGGVANSLMMTDMIRKRIEYLAPVEIVAGTREMQALANGILRVLNGIEKSKLFSAEGGF
ncbi:MAG: butyrate kinase [Clostridiaceae bacterium]